MHAYKPWQSDQPMDRYIDLNRHISMLLGKHTVLQTRSHTYGTKCCHSFWQAFIKYKRLMGCAASWSYFNLCLQRLDLKLDTQRYSETQCWIKCNPNHPFIAKGWFCGIHSAVLSSLGCFDYWIKYLYAGLVGRMRERTIMHPLTCLNCEIWMK